MKKIFLFLFFLSTLSYAISQTIDPGIMRAMETAIEDSTYPNVHSVLIARNNKIIYEKYWAGSDKRGDVVLGIVPHAPDSLHSTQSISKSVVSACVGIAIAQGKLKSVNEKALNFFPEFKTQDTGLKAMITIKDLLTMTAGLQWDEGDYNDPANSEHQMNIAENPAEYILSRPMTDLPGKKFSYNGGATQLLAIIVERVTGKPLEAFAKEYLFTPLGTSAFKWTKTDNSDMPDAASGLYLSSRDMIKFGLLYMNDGKNELKQIIPANWVSQSITPYIVADDGSDPMFGKSEYGFQWWMFNDSIMGKPVPLAACVGNGGQRIFIDKANHLVVVFTGGNYRMPERYLIPYNILKKFIYPALFKE